jgi:hypothetical protein
VQLAIGALQNVLSEDFKATDIEVPVVAEVMVSFYGRVMLLRDVLLGNGRLPVFRYVFRTFLNIFYQSDQPNAQSVRSLQVGVVQAGVQGGAFRVLPTSEVDEHLTALSERD